MIMNDRITNDRMIESKMNDKNEGAGPLGAPRSPPLGSRQGAQELRIAVLFSAHLFCDLSRRSAVHSLHHIHTLTFTRYEFTGMYMIPSPRRISVIPTPITLLEPWSFQINPELASAGIIPNPVLVSCTKCQSHSSISQRRISTFGTNSNMSSGLLSTW